MTDDELLGLFRVLESDRVERKESLAIMIASDRFSIFKGSSWSTYPQQSRRRCSPRINGRKTISCAHCG